jgi:hypothetical protein
MPTNPALVWCQVRERFNELDAGASAVTANS